MHPFCIAPQEDFSIGAANDFIQEFKEGTLKPTVMSKRVPKKSKAALKEVVGKTFKKMVLQSKRDVLIEFTPDGRDLDNVMSIVADDLKAAQLKVCIQCHNFTSSRRS